MTDVAIATTRHGWENRLNRQPMDRVGDSLVFAETYERPGRPGVFGSVVSYIVDKIYLGHNRTPAVKRTLRKLAEDFERTGGIGLNFGAGGSERRPNMVNLDVYLNDTMHVVYDGRSIPFEDETFDLVMSQEVFEHIPDCQAALDEVARVMKKGGKFYLQLPFTIGYHSLPHDYWRFSGVGIEQFVTSQGSLKVLEKGIAAGHGTGFYRILVEFFATTASALGSVFYKPVKMAAAILFWWVKLFDVLTPLASERDRIAGGYYVVAERV